MMLRLMALLLALAATPAAAQQPTKPLTYSVIRTSDRSFAANIILLMGEKKALLIDAPYTRADAHRVVAAILESGRELETIYVTHDHPDHFYSAEVIRQAFPDAKFVSHPAVVAAIWKSLPYKQKRWTKLLGANGPQMPTAPWPLESNRLTLEGHPIEILGPMVGDRAENTALWVPGMKALFAGDLVHNQVVLWFVESSRAQIAEYGRSIDRLIALDPKIVVPGHDRPGLPRDKSALAFTRAYIAAWQQHAAQSSTSAELIAKMKKAFPDAIDPNGDFALTTSAKVTMGEEKPWDE